MIAWHKLRRSHEYPESDPIDNPMGSYEQHLGKLGQILTPWDFPRIRAALEATLKRRRAADAEIAYTLALAGMSADDITEHGFPIARKLINPSNKYGTHLSPRGAAECLAAVVNVGAVTGPAIRLAGLAVQSVREAH